MTGTALQVSQQKTLRALVEQIERLSEERAAIAADISDKFKDAKSKGFDVKVLRKLIALRKLSQAEREEAEALLSVYSHACGWEHTPLGEIAEPRKLAVV